MIVRFATAFGEVELRLRTSDGPGRIELTGAAAAVEVIRRELAAMTQAATGRSLDVAATESDVEAALASPRLGRYRPVRS